MKLTTKEMQTIIVEEMTGQEPTNHSEAASRFRDRIKLNIRHAKEKGYTIEIPPEWEVEGVD